MGINVGICIFYVDILAEFEKLYTARYERKSVAAASSQKKIMGLFFSNIVVLALYPPLYIYTNLPKFNQFMWKLGVVIVGWILFFITLLALAMAGNSVETRDIDAAD